MNDQSSFTIIPPPPVTDKITLSLRGAVRNESSVPAEFDIAFYVDAVEPSQKLHSAVLKLMPGESGLVDYRFPTAKIRGKHDILMTTDGNRHHEIRSKTMEVLPASCRSVSRLGGAWNGFYHWSEEEGMLWNSALRNLTAEQWREQVLGMKQIGLDIIVVQELFRNQMYYGDHEIPETRYEGKAYYPSELFPGRMPIACPDPLEAIMSEADRLGMNVFPGIGLYAWFDYTPHSLEWHRNVASELWERYGHHPSFYGFYISEEIAGDLGGTETRKEEIIDFFRDFRRHCRTLAPDKPVMLAPNCWYIEKALDAWPRLLKHIDILCPFAFHRMNEDDISGEEAAALLQRLCDQSGTHLWMDMELFLFDTKNALYPRDIKGLLSDMHRFPNFEKILGYQYQGLLCAPGASVMPGGQKAEKLFKDYKDYLERINDESPDRGYNGVGYNGALAPVLNCN